MNFSPAEVRILIVDDTLQNIQVLGTTLKKEGYQLNAAQNGKQAINLARKTVPDLILLDIMMPEMDGFSVCQKLKEDEQTSGIPVVFLTAKVETEDLIKGFELGAVDYITKPFNATELLKRVETHLELSLLRQNLEDQVQEKAAQLQVEHAERLRAEKQLAQTQRLEAVGRLAFGAAHEINSPMQSIAGNLAFLKDALDSLKEGFGHYEKLREQAGSGQLEQTQLSAVEEALEDADLDYVLSELPSAIAKMQSNVDRVGKIVRAMQDLSRPSDEDPEPTNLNELVENGATALHKDWESVADLKLELDPQLPSLLCHPGDFAQVVVHLLTNAAQAIADQNSESKGVLTARTACDGDVVEFSISDTGTGIPEDARERLFDPFFTTRDVGKGTGIGLSLVHDVVVNRLGGEIRFETATGEGTTFIVRLPATGGK